MKTPSAPVPWHQCCYCKKEKQAGDFYYSRTKVSGGKQYRSACCKSCEKERIKAAGKERRSKLLEYGGGKCKRCGYDRCMEALEFHHRDRSKKDIHISKIRSISDKVLEELSKCDLLCANCHREAHYLI